MARDSISCLVLLSIFVLGAFINVCEGEFYDHELKGKFHDHGKGGKFHNRGLRYNFYRKSCPQVEELVRKVTWKLAASNSDLSADLIRLQFHDCFVRGCDASVLLDSVGKNVSEKDAGASRTLDGFDELDEIKSEVEKACPGVVSCADVLALASRDAVSFQYKRPLWRVQTGRRDGTVSLASDIRGNIPSSFSNFTVLKDLFASKGLNVFDLVALSGAHTLGRAHCGAFSRRLYDFTGKGDQDPSLNPKYANFLKRQCPNPANPTATVEMDPQSSLSFDVDYFKILLENEGLFQSDAALLTDPQSAFFVKVLQRSNETFISAFGKSVQKMSAIEVLTGKEGEIRKNCHFVN